MSKCNTRKMKDGGKVMKETKMMKEMGRGETKAKMQEMNPGMKKGGMACGGKMKKYAKGGSVTRGDGACMKGHTKGKMV